MPAPRVGVAGAHRRRRGQRRPRRRVRGDAARPARQPARLRRDRRHDRRDARRDRGVVAAVLEVCARCRVGSSAPTRETARSASEGDAWGSRCRGGSGSRRGEEPDRVAVDRRRRARAGPRASCSPAPTGSCTRCGPGACSPSIRSPPCTRNSAELFQTLLAVFQAGWQYVPLNTNLTAAEVGYILGDSGAAALVADAAFADGRARRRPTRPGVPAGGRIAVGGDDPRLHRRSPTLLADQPDTTPDDRVAGQFMQYTSGTTGRPKAVQRDLPQFDPETWVAALQRQPHPLRHRARRRRGAPRHLADVPPVAAVVRLLLAAPRAHRRADGHVGRRARAAADRPVPGHRRRHGADPAAPPDGAARGRARARTTCRRCAR